MSILSVNLIKNLNSVIKGHALTSKSPGYDESRSIWNARINRYPSLIVKCRDTEDIVNTIKFTRDNDLLLSIRAGGHNHTGFAVCNGGVMMDLSGMKDSMPDPENKRITIQPGLTFKEYDAENHKAGLASTGAIVSMVGVPGFTLGGGIGWLHRKAGLGCDNLISAQVVTADGEVVTANEKENTDLFWALRGGGGNFGVVSKLEFKLHPVQDVYAGLIIYPLKDLFRVATFVRDYLEITPDELCIWMFMRRATESANLPEYIHGKHVVILGICYCGHEENGKKVLKPLRDLGKPLADLVKQIPYTEWQQALDPAWGDGFHNEWMGHYINELDEASISTIYDFVSNVTSPNTDVKLAGLGGAINRVNEDETAFSFRNSKFAMVIQTRWKESAESEKHLKWTHDFFNAMKSHGTGKVYVNFISDEGEKRVEDAYNVDTFKKLREIKTKYDPSNFFRMNQNIKPA